MGSKAAHHEFGYFFANPGVGCNPTSFEVKEFLRSELYLGITTSRRPKSRASSENAPGPRQASDIAMTATSPQGSLLPKISDTEGVSGQTMPLAQAIAARNAAGRVRHPRINMRPLSSESNAISDVNRERADHSERYAIP